MRSCTTCQRTLPLEEFHRDRSKPEGRGYRCRACTLTWHREVRTSNAEWLHEQKLHPCTDCGLRFHPAAMQWDHRPGEHKLFGLAAARQKPRALVLAELAKCDLVCANCHAMRTWKRTQEASGIMGAAGRPRATAA